MLEKSDATNYNNYYSRVNNIISVSKLIELYVQNSVFEK